MRLALKIMSITAIVIGVAAIFGAAGQNTTEDAVYSLLGGGLFMTQGILSLVYISRYK